MKNSDPKTRKVKIHRRGRRGEDEWIVGEVIGAKGEKLKNSPQKSVFGSLTDNPINHLKFELRTKLIFPYKKELMEDTSFRGKPGIFHDTEPQIITYEKYCKIKTGMSYNNVVRIIGSPGKEMSRSKIAGIETIMYMWQNGNGSNMNAMFQDGKLTSKAQFGLK